jgi:uncharacterized membrane protein YfcA
VVEGGGRRRAAQPGQGAGVNLLLLTEYGVVAAVAAILGSMLGLGGGVFLVPILTLFFGVDPKLAVGASAVVVATNSVVGSSVHLRSHFTNLRLATLFLLSTAAGAIVGARLGVDADPRVLLGVFGAVLLYAAVSMIVKPEAKSWEVPPDAPDPYLLGAMYPDPAIGREISYVPERVPAGVGIGAGAGVISGLLGVGGGVVMVPVMNLLMRVPMKASVGTSAYMVGMTSVATAFTYYSRGKIDPTIVVPALIGVFAGGQLGSRLTRKLRAQRLSLLFALILFYLSVSLLVQTFGIPMPWQR